MITTGGIHKETVVGNPLDDKNAKVTAIIPKATYFLWESLSEEKPNFHSFILVGPTCYRNAMRRGVERT